MKWLENNVFLSLLLIALTIGLYLKEKPDKISTERADSLSRILPDSIERIEFKGKVLTKKKSAYQYNDTGVLIPELIITNYFSAFNEIIIDEENVILPGGQNKTFDLSINNYRLQFFAPNKLTGNFFITMSSKDKIKNYLVYSTREYEGLYKNEADLRLKSYNITKQRLVDWSAEILKTPLVSSSFSRYVRDMGGDSRVEFDFTNALTIPNAPKVLGYKDSAFFEFKKELSELTPIDILKELTRPSKNWGTIHFDANEFELHSLDGVYYLKKDNLYWKLSENGINTILMPANKLWGEQFRWLEQTFAELKDFKFRFGNKDLPIHVNDKSELVFKTKGLGQKHIQGIKEVLCYVSKCRKEYQVIRINKKNKTGAYPYQIEFSNHKLSFKIEGPVLKLFDPESKVELEYLWSLFRDGDLFQELSRL